MHKKDLKVRAVPVPLGNKHPPPPSDVLPQHEFTMGIIAPKGSGKTTVIVNLLDFYKGYFHTILVFSPTVQSDDKWDYVKKQKYLVENRPLKNWLKEMEENRRVESNSVVEQAPCPNPQEIQFEPFTGFIEDEHFFEDYDDDTFRNIMEQQNAVIKVLKKHKKPKHLANR